MALEGKRVLYISYNGMLDPLGQSQVIPYLKELSKAGVRFTLLSFERERAYTAKGVAECRDLHRELAEHQIEWHWLRYHKRPSLPATMFDVAQGIRLSRRLVKQNKIELVHARSHIPAVIAWALKKSHGTKLIFDVRGLMAEEYIDAGHWKSKAISTRLSKFSEAQVLRAADGIVTLTRALWKEMQSWPVLTGRAVAHEIIPCCIDLAKYRFDSEQRTALRNELGVGDRLVLVYSGSIGGSYMVDEMAAFFRILKRTHPDAFFLWLTQAPPALVDQAMMRGGSSAADYQVRTVEPVAMPNYLSVADAGIAFYRSGVSRLGTSPVKVSEYLSCGLPVIVNTGIGDTDEIVRRHDVGALVESFSSDAYERAIAILETHVHNHNSIRARAREAAEKLFDLRHVGGPAYARLYKEVLRGKHPIGAGCNNEGEG